MALSRFSKLIVSRWVLLPLALLAGGAAGAAAVLVYAQRQLTAQLPFRAVMIAETLARFDRGDTAGAHELLRVDLESTLQGAAVNAEVWGIDLNTKSRELRNVATYLSRSPSIQLPPDAARMMAAFAPFTEAELSSGECRSGICELARSAPSQTATTRPAGEP